MARTLGFLNPNKAALLLFSVAVLLAGGTKAVRAQSALDGFDPNANGTVRVVVVQPDGKILIGGSFTTLSPNGGVPVTRNHIARLNSDGTLDTNFNPNANGIVYSIAVQADGKILAGGEFSGASSIGGQSRNRFARLDATNGLADSFNPNADAAVISIAVQADGKILACGYFENIGGQPRNYIARLDATNGAADSFDPNPDDNVNSIAVQADGKILACGTFATIGGQPRNNIARLEAATGLADAFNPDANNVVNCAAVQADGKILVGGNFITIGGQSRNYIARLDATTGLADSFNPDANNDVVAIAVQTDGRILACGRFTGLNSIGGKLRNYMARLDPTTGLADSFEPNPSVEIASIAVQADGKILAGGYFTLLYPNGGPVVLRNYITRLEIDGVPDQTLNLSMVGTYVYATAVQPDGKILIGGSFETVLGVARTNIARLNTDGTLDTVFNPNADNEVDAIALQADGKILVGGGFTSIGGVARNRIARLDATTGAADLFNPNANNQVTVIAVQADGKILVGGGFSGANSIGGQLRNRIARLDATTGLADTFNPNANSSVDSIVVQADGKILAGGGFNGANSIGGQLRNRIARLDATLGLADAFDPNPDSSVTSLAVQADGKILAGGSFIALTPNGGATVTRRRIARLNTDGTVDTNFNPNANGAVLSIGVQADGKILVGGYFGFAATSIGGQPRNYIARLDATNGLADSFAPAPNDAVLSIAVQADGKILAGGQFATISGQSRNLFARLANDTAALQNLAATQTNITWTRGGTSPQFTRVAFESSTNNVNYTPLGSGSATGNNWSLTNLNLATGQNLYIRARGYYGGGYQNGSGSIQESVRNVWLFPAVTQQPLLNIQPSANTNVVLSWATNFTGFTLEANTNLNTNAWSTVSPAPTVSGTNNVVTNAAGGPMKYFRLRAP